MNEYIPNEDAATEQSSTFRCDKCERSFPSVFGLRMHTIRSHGKGWDTSGNFRSKSWTPEQHAKFKATMRRKRRKGNLTRKPIRYVYPEPENDSEKVARSVTKAVMRYCPFCGENIEKHL